MPEKETLERARKAKRSGKSASSQAGEFVREEVHHVREGKHGARSTKQAIAIGLSKARRAGVALKPPERGKASERTRQQAARDVAKGQREGGARSLRRSRASSRALDREGRSAASRAQLARQGRKAAQQRTRAERSASAKKAARTRKANRTRAKKSG
jgi:hypothetical protein